MILNNFAKIKQTTKKTFLRFITKHQKAGQWKLGTIFQNIGLAQFIVNKCLLLFLTGKMRKKTVVAVITSDATIIGVTIPITISIIK